MVRNSYHRFFEEIVDKDAFLEFGLKEIIFPDPILAKDYWDQLKKKYLDRVVLPIRDFGRRGNGNDLLMKFFTQYLGFAGIQFDPTGNRYPADTLGRLSAYSKYKTAGKTLLLNYQVSHVFGLTKNPLAYTAPWNLVFMPKMFDPFTGHEAKGEEVLEFKNRFQAAVIERFRPMIEEFNQIMSSERNIIKSKSVETFTQLEKQKIHKFVDETFVSIHMGLVSKP